jgi:hypothetical protein
VARCDAADAVAGAAWGRGPPLSLPLHSGVARPGDVAARRGRLFPYSYGSRARVAADPRLGRRSTSNSKQRRAASPSSGGSPPPPPAGSGGGQPDQWRGRPLAMNPGPARPDLATGRLDTVVGRRIQQAGRRSISSKQRWRRPVDRLGRPIHEFFFFVVFLFY